jgi:Fe-S cluster assembly iron-binding protein IscA
MAINVQSVLIAPLVFALFTEETPASILTAMAINVQRALGGLPAFALNTKEGPAAKALTRTARSVNMAPIALLVSALTMEAILASISTTMAINVRQAPSELLYSALRTKEDVDVQTALNGLIVAVEKRSLMAIVQHVTIDCFQTLQGGYFEITRPRNMQCFVTSSSIFLLIIS